jgi:hypothetical protein
VKGLLAFAILLPGLLKAELASHQPWLGGALPGEVVSYMEIDLKLTNRLSEGLPLWGARADMGIGSPLGFPETMISLEWRWLGEQGKDLELGIRMAPLAVRPFLDALYLEAEYQSWTSMGRRALGLVWAFHPWDWELCLNSGAAMGLGRMDWENRLGLRSPYLTWFLQPGLDASWRSDGQGASLTPQLFINLPGDVSIHFGATVGPQAPLWSFLLSYEIFPTP